MLARRTVLKAFAGLPLAAAPLAAAPLAAVLADPRLAHAAAEGLATVHIVTDGGRAVSGALARPETAPTAAVLLVHEWWGLNDQIKSVAAELAKQGYGALAIDLYDGAVTGEPDEARALMQAVDPGAARDVLASWIPWLRAQDWASGKIGTVGWCIGGGWSLNASLVRPVDATVIYYGNVAKTAAELGSLKGPVLGHFATRDGWITSAMVAGFEAALEEAGKAYVHHWYEADHAFANPTNARYDAEDAALAWRRTLAFFEENLS
jgi:carboxymethylenebutenolidase